MSKSEHELELKDGMVKRPGAVALLGYIEVAL